MRRKKITNWQISACLASAAISVLSSMSARAGEITSFWSGNSGNWTDPTQWSTNPNYPNNGTPAGTTYDAVISATGAGPYTVALNNIPPANSITTDGVTLNSANATISQSDSMLTATTLDVSAGTYSLNNANLSVGNLVNTGTIQVSNTSGFSVGTTLDNTSGTIEVDTGSLATVVGSISTTSDLGELINNGGTIAIASNSVIDNSGQTFTFGGASGKWVLQNVNIDGGILDLPTTTSIMSATLQNLALASDLTDSGNQGFLVFQNVNAGGHSVYMSGSESEFIVSPLGPNSPPVTLSNVNINLGGSTANTAGAYLFHPNTSLTLSGTVTVSGWGGVGGTLFSQICPQITNQGTVTANIPLKALLIFPSVFINMGTVQAENGGILTISPGGSTTWTNNGTLGVDNLSTIDVDQNLTFAKNTTFAAELGENAGAGILSITGNLNIQSSVSLNLSLGPGTFFQTPYEIASYTGALSGTFESVTPGFTVDYSQPGEIFVTAIPEPGSCTIALCGTFMAIGRRRKRRAVILLAHR